MSATVTHTAAIRSSITMNGVTREDLPLRKATPNPTLRLSYCMHGMSRAPRDGSPLAPLFTTNGVSPLVEEPPFVLANDIGYLEPMSYSPSADVPVVSEHLTDRRILERTGRGLHSVLGDVQVASRGLETGVSE